MQTVRITTSQNIDIDYEVAGLGDRIAARVIDYMLFLCLYTLVIMIFAIIIGANNYEDGSSANSGFKGTNFLIMMAVWLGMCVFYDLITEVFFNGQSIGKRSMKIRVISMTGARPRVGQYLLRWIFRILDFGISGGTAAVITVAFSDNKQRIGDMVANTTLIKTAPPNKYADLVFGPPPADYEPTYQEVMQLNDRDIVLIHDVIKNFNRTRNSNMVYRLALRVKDHLGVTYAAEINEYRFLEIIVNDYNYHIAKNDFAL
jgi:uncharacterized RDD family membrane protein YckC